MHYAAARSPCFAVKYFLRSCSYRHSGPASVQRTDPQSGGLESIEAELPKKCPAYEKNWHSSLVRDSIATTPLFLNAEPCM